MQKEYAAALIRYAGKIAVTAESITAILLFARGKSNHEDAWNILLAHHGQDCSSPA
jgi:hypothetical protein